jgi:xanthine dehydrogenase YagR molybdenum-binding subunit
VTQKLGFNVAGAEFADGQVRSGNRSAKLAEAARDGELVAKDGIEYGDLDKQYEQSTFASHFVEAAVDGFTGETRIRRMLAVCAAGRILNPTTARSQVIGAMTMGVGAALMEDWSSTSSGGFSSTMILPATRCPFMPISRIRRSFSSTRSTTSPRQ